MGDRERLEAIRANQSAWEFYERQGKTHADSDSQYMIDSIRFLLGQVDQRDEWLTELVRSAAEVTNAHPCACGHTARLDAILDKPLDILGKHH